MTVAAPFDTGTLLITWVQRRSKPFILLASLATIVVVGLIDAITGPDLSVLTFYFLPVLLSTWFVGRGAGMAMSAFCAAGWITIDLVVNGGHIAHGVSIWNSAIHLIFFTLGVWSVGELKESLDRQRRAERQRVLDEIETAREVQNALMPKDPGVNIRGFDLAASCESARGISGDFYDVIVLDDARFLLALGDVSGKGVPAALLGASLLAGLRGLAPIHRDRVDQLVAQLNGLLQKASPSVRYATLFVAEYDFTASRLRWVNAGHVAGLVFRPTCPVPARLVSSGTVVGLFPDSGWELHELPFEPGDTLLLFSDGLSEAVDPDDMEFGEERIIRTVLGAASEPADGIHRALIEAVTRFTGGAPLSDDRTVVVLRREW